MHPNMAKLDPLVGDWERRALVVRIDDSDARGVQRIFRALLTRRFRRERGLRRDRAALSN